MVNYDIKKKNVLRTIVSLLLREDNEDGLLNFKETIYHYFSLTILSIASSKIQ